MFDDLSRTLLFLALKKFLVVYDYGVVGEFTDVKMAKLRMNKIKHHQRLIAEVNEQGYLMPDPQTRNEDENQANT